MAVKETAPAGTARIEYVHAKCGSTIIQLANEPVIGATEDCATCKEVRHSHREYQQNRATPGTPLAEELNLKVFIGQVG